MKLNIYVPIISKTLECIKTFNTNCKVVSIKSFHPLESFKTFNTNDRDPVNIKIFNLNKLVILKNMTYKRE